MGKKKYGYQPEVREPGSLDRLWENRNVRILTSALVVVAFALIAILVVTLLGGDELSTPDQRLVAPTPIGQSPSIERSAAADVLDSKTWDEMSEEERSLLESEVDRVFADSSFRASSALVVANDIERRDGKTVLSRLYLQAEGAGGPELAQRILFYCETPDGILEPHRYILSSSGNQYEIFAASQYPRSWNTILSDVKWTDVRDAGWKDIDGRRAHGFEVAFVFTGGAGSVPADESEGGRALYWFDVENARLLERAKVVKDQDVQKQGTYLLDYRELSPVVVPDDLEQPPCVQEILARVRG